MRGATMGQEDSGDNLQGMGMIEEMKPFPWEPSPNEVELGMVDHWRRALEESGAKVIQEYPLAVMIKKFLVYVDVEGCEVCVEVTHKTGKKAFRQWLLLRDEMEIGLQIIRGLADPVEVPLMVGMDVPWAQDMIQFLFKDFKHEGDGED